MTTLTRICFPRWKLRVLSLHFLDSQKICIIKEAQRDDTVFFLTMMWFDWFDIVIFTGCRLGLELAKLCLSCWKFMGNLFIFYHIYALYSRIDQSLLCCQRFSKIHLNWEACVNISVPLIWEKKLSQQAFSKYSATLPPTPFLSQISSSPSHSPKGPEGARVPQIYHWSFPTI